MGKRPLIELLLARFPGTSERELRAAILRGAVSADGETLLKPGTLVPAGSELSLRSLPRFVSRGGEKLADAVQRWWHDAAGKVYIDAGCSTGGFTDCLLQAGAARVYSVDVGYNQLAWRLRRDPRVVALERTNVMSIARGDLVPPPHRAVADLSFRSLRGAAAHILGLTVEAQGIFLVKPQFEWTSPPEDFHGVVESPGELRAILEELIRELSADGVRVRDAAPSPVRGRRGNREFLFLLDEGATDSAVAVERLILE